MIPLSIAAQTSRSGSMALSPARFELEMNPGDETTVLLNLDYKAGDNTTQPVRIVASLNDWTISPDGRIEFSRANSLPNSAISWLIYSPGETAVLPGTIHQIRVTVSVPLNAKPGDHLAALIVEQRPENLKFEQSVRQMIVRYRMASVFYIKVGKLTRRGTFENLYAEATSDGVVVTPTLKNEGNTMIRPVSSVKIVDAEGKVVADLPEADPLPILADSSSKPIILIGNALRPGAYTVKYRIDFQDGGKPIEGITDLVVKPAPQIAASGIPARNP